MTNWMKRQTEKGEMKMQKFVRSSVKANEVDPLKPVTGLLFQRSVSIKNSKDKKNHSILIQSENLNRSRVGLR